MCYGPSGLHYCAELIELFLPRFFGTYIETTVNKVKPSVKPVDGK